MKPKMITSIDCARRAAADYYSCQFRSGKWLYGDDRRVKWERLAADPSPTPESVNAIMGNASWTALCCVCCGRTVAAVVRVDSDDPDNPAADVCRECWAEGYALWGTAP